MELEDIEGLDNKKVEIESVSSRFNLLGLLKISLIPIVIFTILFLLGSLDGATHWVNNLVDIARSPSELEFTSICNDKPQGEVSLSVPNGIGLNQFVVLKGEKSMAVYSDFTFTNKLLHEKFDGKIERITTQFSELDDIINISTRSAWDFGGFTVSVAYKDMTGQRLRVYGISPYWYIYSNVFGDNYTSEDRRQESIEQLNKTLSGNGIKERLPLSGKPIDISSKFALVCDLSLNGLEFVGIDHGILATNSGRDSLLLLDRNGEDQSRLEFGKFTSFFHLYSMPASRKIVYAYDGRSAYEITHRLTRLWIDSKIDTGEYGDARLTSLNNDGNEIITDYNKLSLFNGKRNIQVDFVSYTTRQIQPFLTTKNWNFRIFEHGNRHLLADFQPETDIAYEFPFKPIDWFPISLAMVNNSRTDLLYWKDSYYDLMFHCPITVMSNDTEDGLVLVLIMPWQSNCIGFYKINGVSKEASRLYATCQFDDKLGINATNLYIVSQKDVYRCQIGHQRLPKLKPGRIFLNPSEIKLRTNGKNG